MNYIYKFLCLVLTSSLFLASCSNSSEEKTSLAQVKKQLENAPADAAKLLAKIENPDLLPPDLYMEYIVYSVNVKNKLGQDIANDTLIFRACEYFNDKGPKELAALAYFNAGEVCKKREQYKQSLEYFFQAENYSKITMDNILIGKTLNNIASIYYIQEVFDKAQEYYTESLSYFEKVEGSELKQLFVIRSLSLSYLYQNKFTETLRFINKGIDLSEKNNNREYKTTFLHQLGTYYRSQNSYTEAIVRLNEALSLTENQEEKYRIYLSLAKVYIEQKNRVKALEYVVALEEKVESLEGEYSKNEFYAAISEFYGQNNNKDQQLKYERLKFESSKKIQEKQRQSDLVKAEQNYMLLQKRTEFENRRNMYIAIGVFLFVLALTVVYFLARQSRIRLKQELLRQLDAEKAKNDLGQIENTLLNMRYTANSLYDIVQNLFGYYIQFVIDIDRLRDEPNISKYRKDVERCYKRAMIKVETDVVAIGRHDLTIEMGNDLALKELDKDEIFIVTLYYYFIRDKRIADILNIDDMEKKLESIMIKLEEGGMSEDLIFRIFYYFEAD